MVQLKVGRREQEFEFIEVSGDVSRDLTLVCLHGLFGTTEEWVPSASYVAQKGYRVLLPSLYYEDVEKINPARVPQFARFVDTFIQSQPYSNYVIAGNSLGGQVALHFVLEYPGVALGMILAGSAGLEENTLDFRSDEGGFNYVPVDNREFLRERAGLTFYDPNHVSEEILDRIQAVRGNPKRALRTIRVIRNSRKHRFDDLLKEIHLPTAIIWGSQDYITPPEVAHQFADGIENSVLRFIDLCGHAPLIEHPTIFGEHITDFLDSLSQQ